MESSEILIAARIRPAHLLERGPSKQARPQLDAPRVQILFVRQLDLEPPCRQRAGPIHTALQLPQFVELLLDSPRRRV
jgi:hypothetical protein